MGIKIEGLEKLTKKLEYLGGNSSGVIDKGLALGAEKIKADAKTACPADTGHLKASIVREKNPNGYAVGTNVKYAPYVEYGTGTKGDPSVPHTQREKWTYRDEKGNYHTAYAQPPRHFLLKSFESNKETVAKLVRKQLSLALNEKMRGAK